MRKNLKILIALAIIVCLSLSLFACNTDINTETDDDFELVLKGLISSDVKITKKQIKDLYNEKPVNYTENNTCSPSDKTDDDGNLLKHTLKGVYLDDVIDKYIETELKCENFVSIKLESDGDEPYNRILSSNQYNSDDVKSKIIIAFDFDGFDLSSDNSEMGALRIVIPNQPASNWIKELKTITFGEQVNEEAERIQGIVDIYFMELFGSELIGEITNDNGIGTFRGLSVKKLIDEGYIFVEESDILYLISNDDRENTYEYVDFIDGLFAFEVYKNNAFEADSNAPYYINKSMMKFNSAKFVTKAIFYNSALISLEQAFGKGAIENVLNVEYILSDLLELDFDRDFTITDIDGTETIVTFEILNSATITKSEGVYVLSYDDVNINLFSISLNR